MNKPKHLAIDTKEGAVIVRYFIYDDGSIALVDLLFEAPLVRDHNGVQVASALTNLQILIHSVHANAAPFKELRKFIWDAIKDAES